MKVESLPLAIGLPLAVVQSGKASADLQVSRLLTPCRTAAFYARAGHFIANLGHTPKTCIAE
jgi:hypothetical protein